MGSKLDVKGISGGTEWEGCCACSGSTKSSVCSLAFLTCCSQFFNFFIFFFNLFSSQLSSGLFNQDL